MKTIKLNLQNRSYNIVIGKGILKTRLGKFLQNLNLGNAAFIITNNTIKTKYEKILSGALRLSHIGFKLITVPDSEKSKSLETACGLIKNLADYDKKRKVFVIAFGGGVIGDLAGFVASIYKRGIPYAQIGTTVLAQVDSSIGGKTGVDLKQGKNLAGAFYQPKLVFSDVAFLESLDLRQIRSGLAEVIKYGIIKDPGLFDYLEKESHDCETSWIKKLDFEFLVSRCGAIKAKIVSLDEKEEKGYRTILNFGHTIGHAIEAAGNYKKYNHGEAIALGMLVACDISEMLGLTHKNTCLRIENVIASTGLPTKIKKISPRDIIKSHYLDKKFIGSRNRFVLLEKIGKVKVVEDIPLEIIKSALAKKTLPL